MREAITGATGVSRISADAYYGLDRVARQRQRRRTAANYPASAPRGPLPFSGLIRFPENRKYTVPEEWDAFLLVHFDSYTAEWLPVEPTPCPPAAQVYPIEQLSGDLIIARL